MSSKYILEWLVEGGSVCDDVIAVLDFWNLRFKPCDITHGFL